jgi:Putative Flp pilus-assembly TadE/G-like
MELSKTARLNGIAILNRAIKDENGTVAPIFGVSLVMLSAFIGGAVDYGRWTSARQQTALAVDAAVLAASRMAQTSLAAGDTEAVASTKAVAAANDYYAKMKSQHAVDDAGAAITFEKGATAHDWKVKGAASVNTPFLSLVGLGKLGVKPKSAASVALGGNGYHGLNVSGFYRPLHRWHEDDSAENCCQGSC